MVALGRKNYLFAGSDAGGERAAAIYSLIGSAKLNGIDPEAYLREVLTHRRPSHQPHRRTPALEARLRIRFVNVIRRQDGLRMTLTV